MFQVLENPLGLELFRAFCISERNVEVVRAFDPSSYLSHL